MRKKPAERGSIEMKNTLFNNMLSTATALALAACLAVSGCTHSESAAPSPRPALVYRITSGAGIDSDVYAGEIRARHEIDHAFRIGGKVAQRLVDAGTAVKKGQLLARLDPQDARLAADAASAQAAAQQTEAAFAGAEMRRYQDLFAKGFISQSALDQKINAANSAKAKLDALRAQADVSVNQAGYAALHAETDGVVIQVMAEAGQVVAQGQPVLKIANPKEKELAISAPEARLDDFRRALDKSAPRELRVASWAQPEKRFQARIREIGAAADPVTRTYAVRIALIEADDSLQLGMSAFAVFIGANAPDVLTVPLSALYAHADAVGVWQVAGDGKVSLKPVKVVQYRETSAVIKAENGSIKSGDTIVAAGVHKLREGEIVRPVTDPLVTGDGKVALAPTPAEGTQKQDVATLKRLYD